MLSFLKNPDATQEINWFDFETRMRKLIHEMVEPTVRKVNEDRDNIYKISKESDK